VSLVQPSTATSELKVASLTTTIVRLVTAEGKEEHQEERVGPTSSRRGLADVKSRTALEAQKYIYIPSFVKSCYINYSWLANATCSIIGDNQNIRTARNITAVTEITLFDMRPELQHLYRATETTKQEKKLEKRTTLIDGHMASSCQKGLADAKGRRSRWSFQHNS